MEIKVRLFGPFRVYFGSSEITLTIPERSRISDIISSIKAKAGNRAEITTLIDSSVIANEEKILSGEDIAEEKSYAILPPISGG